MMDADVLNKTEAWRQIPPEIKLEMMNKAHAKGVFAVLMAIATATTCTIALKQMYIFWSCVIISPFIFQFATGKAWRAIKPVIMLQFLAVRSAARRFAYQTKSRDLDLRLVFPGELEKVFDSDDVQQALEHIVDDTLVNAAWITLFADTVVVLTEEIGGARLEWACPITHELSMEIENPDSKGKDYAPGKQITLVEKKATYERRIKLRSQYPGALIVFQKQLQSLINEKLSTAKEIKNLNSSPAKETSSLLSSSDEPRGGLL
ncbi:MAG: hypothetical protein KDD62_01675 [Bdellovibrionales bacterium]|nr:hypothetical protein [Bdellovibrionales bacterium]